MSFTPYHATVKVILYLSFVCSHAPFHVGGQRRYQEAPDMYIYQVS